MSRTPREPSSTSAFRAALVLVGCVLGALSLPLVMGNTGCATRPVLKGLGEPCTRTSECETDLTCSSSGVCTARPDTDAGVARDASLEVGPADGG